MHLVCGSILISLAAIGADIRAGQFGSASRWAISRSTASAMACTRSTSVGLPSMRAGRALFVHALGTSSGKAAASVLLVFQLFLCRMQCGQHEVAQRLHGGGVVQTC